VKGVQGIQTTLPIGSVVQGRYRIEGLLGKGGFGAVYLVRDQRVRGNLFALKELIDPSKKERERFTFEGEVLKRLDHRALPRVYRAFEDDQNMRAYILMDYIEGPNLEMLRLQQPEKRFTLPQTLKMMAPIVSAIMYLHKQKPPIVHRDIKPSNIIVPPTGDEAVLVDFGIAKEYDKDATTTAVRRCSPGYGAPEQYAMGTNPRTDIYGLAATLYVLLTGVVPADAFHRMTQIGSNEVDPLEPVTRYVPEIPEEVANVIQRAMAVNSNDRYASVEEFWKALKDSAGEDTMPRLAAVSAPPAEGVVPDTTTAPTMVITRDRSYARRGRKAALLLLLVALVAVLLLGGLFLGPTLLENASNTGNRGTTSTPPRSATHAATAPATHATATPASPATTTPATTTPAAHATATATATPSTTYPRLAATYQGNLTDQYTSPPVTTTMSLSRILQNGATINGYFTVGSELQGNGNFQGQVSGNNKIQFTVQSYAGHPPLFFQGNIQKDGSMSGTYCSYVNGHCDQTAGGYGTWSVAPPNSGSSSSIAFPAIALLPSTEQEQFPPA
jgi:predicted Ser/Thr protein kinase